jgi:hypothetical protein
VLLFSISISEEKKLNYKSFKDFGSLYRSFFSKDFEKEFEFEKAPAFLTLPEGFFLALLKNFLS